jgi:hypothetical protein
MSTANEAMGANVMTATIAAAAIYQGINQQLKSWQIIIKIINYVDY